MSYGKHYITHARQESTQDGFTILYTLESDGMGWDEFNDKWSGFYDTVLK